MSPATRRGSDDRPAPGLRAMRSTGLILAHVVVLLNVPAAARAQSGAASRASPADEIALAIDVTRDWTDTGFDLASGQSVLVTASGWIGVGFQEVRLFSPDGDPTCHGVLGARIVPDLPCWSLIGRIGDGQPFLVGRAVLLENQAREGRLYLGVNDEQPYFGDNRGQWAVTITVDPPHGFEDAAPGPDALLGNDGVCSALIRAFGGVEGGTLAERIRNKPGWKLSVHAQPDLVEGVGLISDLACKGGTDGAWSAPSSARRVFEDEILKFMSALLGQDHGRHAKLALVYALMAVVEEDAVEDAGLVYFERALRKAVDDGLTDEVKSAFRSPDVARRLATACRRMSAIVKIGDPEDLLLIRHRSYERGAHVYDVFVTWTERGAPPQGRGYGDVTLHDGSSGHAHCKLAITATPQGWDARATAISYDRNLAAMLRPTEPPLLAVPGGDN